MTRNDLFFAKNPFTAEVHTVPLDFQEEVLELKMTCRLRICVNNPHLKSFGVVCQVPTQVYHQMQSDNFGHLHQLIRVSVVFRLC